MAKKMLSSLVVLAALPLVASGCLVKDDIAAWYLEPNGAVTWSILEKDVHSDAETAVDQRNEEATYLASVRELNHPMARGLADLQPIEVKTRILRATAPFAVATDARFASLGALGQQLISQLGLTGTSAMIRGADGMTWTFAVRDPHSPAASSASDDDVTGVAGTLEGLKVVLLEGRLVSAQGFHLNGDHRSATLQKWDDDVFKDDGMLVLSLTWK